MGLEINTNLKVQDPIITKNKPQKPDYTEFKLLTTIAPALTSAGTGLAGIVLANLPLLSVAAVTGVASGLLAMIFNLSGRNKQIEKNIPG